MATHAITRTRLNLGWRTLTVTSAYLVTPRMLRVNFHCNELSDFESPSADDHVKLLFQTPDGQEVMRDFTPRAWSKERGSLAIEFAMHDEGPAASWARQAKPGEELRLGGPRGSVVVADDFDWYLLIGDATALPSIMRRLEEFRPGAFVHAVLLVENEAEIQNVKTASRCHLQWIFTTGSSASDSAPIEQALATLHFPDGDGFIWIAGKGLLPRSLYRWAKDERGHKQEWIKAAEYWKPA